MSVTEEAAEKKNEADEFLQKFLIKKDAKRLDKIVKVAEKVIKDTPTIYDTNALNEYLTKRADVLKKILDEYTVTTITQEFPLISKELFEKKRYILFNKNEKKNLWTIADDCIEKTEPDEDEKTKLNNGDYLCLEYPLFFNLKLFTNNEQNELCSLKRGYMDYYEPFENNIKSTITPPTIQTIKNSYGDASEALSKYHNMMKNIYKHPIMGKVLMKTETKPPQMEMIWMSNLILDRTIPERNRGTKTKQILPILAMDFNENSYFIKHIKIEEEPLDKYLKELTMVIEK